MEPSIARIACLLGVFALLPIVLAFKIQRSHPPLLRAIEIVLLSIILAGGLTGVFTHVTGEERHVLAFPVFMYLLTRLGLMVFGESREPHLLPLLGLAIYAAFASTQQSWYADLLGVLWIAATAFYAHRLRQQALIGFLLPLSQTALWMVYR